MSKVDLARLDGPHMGVGADICAAPAAEDTRPVGCQFRVDFRHDVVATLKQNESDLGPIHLSVKGRNAVNECSQLAEQLDPNQPAANDREREQMSLALWVRLHVGALKALDQVVSEKQG